MTTTTRPASIRLSARMNAALNQHAKAMNISKDKLVKEALERTLEDIEDYNDAQATLRKGARPVSMSKLKAELGLGS